MGPAKIQEHGAAAVSPQPVERGQGEADGQALDVREIEVVGAEDGPVLADSIPPSGRLLGVPGE